MKIALPEFSVVVLKGGPVSLLERFALQFFDSDQIIRPTPDGAERLRRRLGWRRASVFIDSGAGTFHQDEVLEFAKQYHANAYAIDFSHHSGVSPSTVTHSVRQQRFKDIFEVLRDTPIDCVNLSWTKMPGDRRDESGSFDIIGDVHGCCDELETLLQALGYELRWSGVSGSLARQVSIKPPTGRRLIFVGDLVDRGPRTPDVLRIVMAACDQGAGFTVPGNHDTKFYRWLIGRDVKLNHGLAQSAEQMGREPLAFHDRVKTFIEALDVYFWCDAGRLLVCHAGIREDFIGRLSKRVRRFCLFGDTSGEKDEAGLPVRYHWAAHYGGPVAIVYGHTPVTDAGWVNNTLCVDTGCCFGGQLTALRWPERQTISVPALATYAERRRAFGHPPVRPGHA